MTEIKNEIRMSIKEEINKEKRDYMNLQSTAKIYRDEINKRMDYLERTQRLQMEQMHLVLMNSGDPRVMQMAEQYFRYEENDELFDERKYERGHLKPIRNKREIALDDKNSRRVIQKSKRMNQISTPSMEDDLEMKRNRKNSRYVDSVENDKKQYEISGINKLRSYVYAVISQIRLKNIRLEGYKQFRMEFLKYFFENYNSMNSIFKNWIIYSTRNAFSSVTYILIILILD
jgi:hypothetical protein